ncbi:MAG: (2E,6E)-farnesyl diphosphate synthase [Chromatiales bacterium]
MTTDPRFDAFLRECRERVEAALERCLPQPDTQPRRLHEAMRYAVLGQGKRVRPALVYAAGRALGVAAERLDGAACAVELVHAYSLVHDDLPAMDDDDLRRGRPTCHRAFDEATAILAGDALQTLAFAVIAGDGTADPAPAARLCMIRALAAATGSRGMAGGQALDLEAEGRDLELVDLENIHIHKTGALIHACVRLGGLCADGPDSDRVQRLEHYAACMGLAFQIRDDILDVEGETEVLGKTRGKDEAREKATYPGLLGLSGARDKAAQLRAEALRSLDAFDAGADPLRHLADYIVGRER